MKILITGNAGSGKTTLSNQIAKLYNIKEVIHLDKFVWEKNWKSTPTEKKEQYFSEIIKKNTWVVDGVSITILNAADIVVFLDYLRKLCFYRAIKRTLIYAFRSRPELPEQSSDIFVFGKLLKIIWNFPNLVSLRIKKSLYDNKNNKLIFHIKKQSDLIKMMNFFKSMNKTKPNNLIRDNINESI